MDGFVKVTNPLIKKVEENDQKDESPVRQAETG